MRKARARCGRPSDPRYDTFFATLAKAGLRPREAFALKPEDVGLRGRLLRVERA
jgi:integrase